jgi:SAM-dependent methyltransferase
MVDEILNKLEEFICVHSDDNPLSVWEREYFKLHGDRYKICLRDVNQFAVGKKILEVGSAPCHFTVLLSESGYEITGVDIHPERARKLIECFSLNVIKCDIEVEPLPFDNASFETIMFCEVIEHMHVNPLHALREMARVLSPSGILLLYTDNLYSLRTIKNFVLGKSINDAVEQWKKFENQGHSGHIRIYSAKEIRGLLSTIGLTPIHNRYYHYNEIKSLRSSIIYRLAPRWLSPNMFFVATKR